MAIRTSSSLVEGILERDTSIPLDPFIRTANLLVDWLDTKDTDGDLSTDMLKEIESYLAAHFYEHWDQQYSSKVTGQASANFQGKTDEGLRGTKYGQTAMLLDVTNNLAQRNQEMITGKKSKVGANWLGTPDDSDRPEPIIDFDDNILPNI